MKQVSIMVCALIAMLSGTSAARAQDTNAILARFKATGSGLDSGFGSNGSVTSSPAGDDFWRKVAMDPDGTRILSVGSFSAEDGTYRMLLARTLDLGQPDSHFGYGGVTTKHDDTLSSEIGVGL